MKIQIHRHNGFEWYEDNNRFIKGYFYDEKGNYFEKENLFKLFDETKDRDKIINKLKDLNGIYSIVFQLDGFTIIACDATRAFPLFYTYEDNQLIISDDLDQLMKASGNHEFDPFSEIEFLASNHTHGKKTLVENIYQVRSSEFLVFQGEVLTRSGFSFQYSKADSVLSSIIDVKARMLSVFENSFTRLAKSLKGKTPILALSSGFDSRIIASFLKEFGFKNTICYTYGRFNSFEIETSKKVAEKLGFQWHFIPYTKEVVGDFLNNNEFQSYLNYASNFNSMPNLQEYFAVKHLKEHQLIPDDSVFIPGYAGDILFGSEFRKYHPLKASISDSIVNLKFDNHPLTPSQKEDLKNEVVQNLKEYQISNKTDNFSAFDDYNFKERIAKYIFNSSSFYTFFGYEFRFPLWDLEILKFFSLVSENLKNGNDIYNKIIFPEFFDKYNINFEKQLVAASKKPALKKTKSILKPLVPTSIKVKKLNARDWNNYELITEGMLHQIQENNLEVKRLYNDYNEIVTQWYLYKLKRQF